jgi:diguanylate cyclase (GGDEF)-like protein/PAS domain S-box-containing protein
MNETVILQQSIQKLFDKGNSVLFRWRNDSSWSIDYVSENVFNFLGYSKEEFLQGKMTYTECIHPDFLAQVQNEVVSASKNGVDFFQHEPYKIITKDNIEKWILDQTVIDRDDNGEILSYTGFINDITKSVTLTDENKLLLQRVHLAIESTNDGIWDWDLSNDEVYFSPYWKSMLGYTNEEVEDTSQAFFNLIHSDDKTKAKNALERHFQDSNVPYLVELRLLCKDGSYKWVLSRGKAIFDADNNPVRMLGSHVDISHQKEVEEKLQESELRWKFAIEGSGDGLWDWNLETNEVYFSPQWKRMLGFEENAIENTLQEWSDRVHPSHLERVYKEVQSYLDGKSDKYISEHQLLCKDGNYKWILDRGIVVQRGTDGKALRMIGTHSDIDKNKKVQEQLTRLNQRSTNMFKNHHAIMLLIEPESGKILDANMSAQKFYGYTFEEFLRLNISDINIASSEEVAKRREQVIHNKSDHFVFEHKKKNGDIAIIETNVATIETEQGSILFSIITDVTKEKEREAKLEKVFSQLQQAQKIAKLGLWEFHHINEKLEWSDEVFNIVEIDKEQFNASYEAFIETIHPDDRDEVNSAYLNSLAIKEPYEITHRLLMPDGRIKYVFEQCDTEFDSNGTPVLSRGTVQDITEFKILDTTMRNERRRFKTIIDNASDGIFVINQEFKIVDYSHMAKTMLGYSDEEMLRLHITDWDAQIDEEGLKNLIASFSDKPVTFETIHRRKDGSTYNASITSVLMDIDDTQYIYASVRDISEVKKLQDAILHERNFIDTIIESANAIIAVIDSDGRMIKLNTYGENFSGYTQEEISQEPYKWRCFLPEDVRDRVVSIVENAKQGNIIKSYQNAWYSKSGESKMFEWSNTLVKKEDGSMDYIATIGIDITQDQEQKTFLNLLINSQSHMMILADGYELKYVNQAVLDFFDFATVEDMRLQYRCVCDTFIENDFSFHLGVMPPNMTWIEAIQQLPSQEQIVSIYSKKENKEKIFKVNVETYDHSKVYLLTFVDISDTMAKQLDLEYKSYHDPLTKAYNRVYFYECYESIMRSDRFSNHHVAIAMIDIDHFKNVNDNYGHDVGDDVLKSLVRIIQENSRASDTLIRWGGEEFILLIPIKNEASFYKTLESLRKTIQNEKLPIVGNITVSIGGALHTQVKTIEDTIRQADKNLYSAKANGRNQVIIL